MNLIAVLLALAFANAVTLKQQN
jgi:hypothetical protein